MEFLGLGNAELILREENIVFTIIQVIVFFVVAFVLIQMLRLYFKNMELKKNPEKNQTEIKENFAKIEKIKTLFLKYGGIIFAVIIIAIIILSNFIEI